MRYHLRWTDSTISTFHFVEVLTQKQLEDVLTQKQLEDIKG